MMPTLIALALTIIEMSNSPLGWNTEFVTFVERLLPSLVWSFGWIAVSMSYAIFIRGLYVRLAALNTLLRYSHSLQYAEMVLIISFIFFNWNRNRFLMDKRLNVFFGVYLKDSIDFIKFVGRQHAFLTDITEQLNVCYGLQVLSFLLTLISQ